MEIDGVLKETLSLISSGSEARANLGGMIRRYRGDHDLSQKDLAEKLKVSSSFLSDVEHGHRTLGPDLLRRLFDLVSTPSPTSPTKETAMPNTTTTLALLQGVKLVEENPGSPLVEHPWNPETIENLDFLPYEIEVLESREILWRDDVAFSLDESTTEPVETETIPSDVEVEPDPNVADIEVEEPEEPEEVEDDSEVEEPEGLD